MSAYQMIRYDCPEERIARVTLARPDIHNAQPIRMIYEINEAFDRAARDEAIRVIILAAEGKNFSSGHYLMADEPLSNFTPVTNWGGFAAPGPEGRQALEEELFLGMCLRWRNLPKPTIAQVQGKVIAGGLMLVWPCDLVVASDDALFSDPVVMFGVNGVEYFAHPWEMGARKAKELLFTGGCLTAQEAYAVGMVNRVVPREELEQETLALARRIALRPAIGLRHAKQSVNQTQDAQGFLPSLQGAMALHQLGHANAVIVHGSVVNPDGAEVIKREAKEQR